MQNEPAGAAPPRRSDGRLTGMRLRTVILSMVVTLVLLGLCIVALVVDQRRRCEGGERPEEDPFRPNCVADDTHMPH
jgi:hypothetical protein